MRACLKRSTRRDAGYIGLAVAGSLVMLCGFVGLATDVGMIYFDKTRMQAAADSAVLAGAQEGIRGNWSSVTSAAQTEATANGYTNGVNGATVTVNNPPVSGDHNGDSLFVETIVARAEPTFFMKASTGPCRASCSGSLPKARTSVLCAWTMSALTVPAERADLFGRAFWRVS